MTYLTKGSRVRIQKMDAKIVSLSGMQMKTGLDVTDFWGTVTHVYGYANTTEEHARGQYTKMTVVVKPDDGGAEEEFDQKHIVEAQVAGGAAGGSAGG